MLAWAVLCLSLLTPSLYQDDACSGGTGVITEDRTYIESPDFFGGIYPNNAYCQWLVQAPEGMVVSLNFGTLDTEHESLCRYDNVQIYDGDSDEADHRVTACGREKPPETITSDNQAFVTFTSDKSNQYSGFKIFLIFIDATAAFDPCLNIQNIGCPSEGAITSPTSIQDGSPSCRWRFSPPKGWLVELEFENFDLALEDGCVVAYDGDSSLNSPVLARYCAGDEATIVTSSDAALFFQFDHYTNSPAGGFRVNYRFIDNLGPGLYRSCPRDEL